jgi:hypothetical protein
MVVSGFIVCPCPRMNTDGKWFVHKLRNEDQKNLIARLKKEEMYPSFLYGVV